MAIFLMVFRTIHVNRGAIEVVKPRKSSGMVGVAGSQPGRDQMPPCRSNGYATGSFSFTVATNVMNVPRNATK